MVARRVLKITIVASLKLDEDCSIDTWRTLYMEKVWTLHFDWERVNILHIVDFPVGKKLVLR